MHVKQDTQSNLPAGSGEAVLMARNATSGAQFVKAFGKVFRQPAPSSQGQPLTGQLKVTTVVLGTNMVREPQGGFRSEDGTWTATKWFLEDSKGDAEEFFNFSTAEMRAEFTEKDEDYRTDLVRLVAMGLRPKTPAQDDSTQE
jgi:hypothetical protein